MRAWGLAASRRLTEEPCTSRCLAGATAGAGPWAHALAPVSAATAATAMATANAAGTRKRCWAFDVVLMCVDSLRDGRQYRPPGRPTPVGPFGLSEAHSPRAHTQGNDFTPSKAAFKAASA